MEIYKTKLKLQKALGYFRAKGKTIGFVPTMGALHQGHVSLIRASKAANSCTVCSIFINPTQFTNLKDLEIYPRPIERDVELLENEAVDILFLPSEQEMYPGHESWNIDLQGLDTLWEGKSRPGHFQGVCQIVYKLFDLVKPTRAYFGQKDFQQSAIISRMNNLLEIPIELVRCPIIREADGLAMSSRNIHLKGSLRENAAVISHALFQAFENSKSYSVAETIHKAVQTITYNGSLSLDYFAVVNAENLEAISNWDDTFSIIALVAVMAGDTRLIDNHFMRPLDIYS